MAAIAMRTLTLVLGVLLGSVGAGSAEPVHGGLIIDHVTVVDVRSGRLLRDRAIVVADGKIVSVERAGSVRAPTAAQRIDGHGRFVVPGYNDMHAHNLNTASPETSLPLMLANGITGFRQMAGAPELLAARAAGKPMLPTESPALLAMPGTILAGPGFTDPAAVREEVVRQKAAGADFIKVIDLPPAAFRAAAEAARAASLPFAGHLPPTEDAREAMRLGIASIEHLGPGISLLLSCSSDEATIRAVLASTAARQTSNFAAPPELVRRMLGNPMLVMPPSAFGLIQRVLATYDDNKCRAFVTDIAASATWMVPTLTRLEAMEAHNSHDTQDNSYARFVPASSRSLWTLVATDFDTDLTDQQRHVLADLFQAQLRLTGLMNTAGVKMMAGTDFGGGWIVPGFSLHHEFDLLARAGVSPLRVLQMTTLDPAKFLGREAMMGTVEAGRNADLVLLDSDPTKSVAALHRVIGVVRAGRYRDRAELDAIESRAAVALQ